MEESTVLANIFYITATIVFVIMGSFAVYLFYLLYQLQLASKKISENLKSISRDFVMTRYSLQATLLKKFLSFIDRKGGVKYGDKE